VSRRDWGTGTIREITTGTDAGSFRGYLTVDGKRRSFWAKTREDVERKMLDARHAKAHNLPVAPPRTWTVKAYGLEWLEDQKAHVRPGTWDGYDSNMRCHVLPSLGSLKLADMTAADVRRLHRESKARGLAPRSVRYVHTTLNLMLKQALADDLVARNVAELAPAPPAERKRVKPFTPAEALRFLEVVKGDEHESLYVTTLGLALRRGEVLGLRWQDVDWAKRQVIINGQLQRIDGEGGGLRWLEPKTDASVAVLDVPDFVMDALLAQKDRQALLSGSSRWRESGYVFTTQRGGPLEPDNVTHYFPAFLKAHGMRHQRFHDLRHSAASLLLAIGVPLWQVSKILRHAGIAITSDTYGHLYPETSRAAADAYGAFLGQGRVETSN
jgi:integrase